MVTITPTADSITVYDDAGGLLFALYRRTERSALASRYPNLDLTAIIEAVDTKWPEE